MLSGDFGKRLVHRRRPGGAGRGQSANETEERFLDQQMGEQADDDRDDDDQDHDGLLRQSADRGDLHQPSIAHHHEGVGEIQRIGGITKQNEEPRHRGAWCADRQDAGDDDDCGKAPRRDAWQFGQTGGGVVQIGRASCRERVSTIV